jgi:hypothetical protein
MATIYKVEITSHWINYPEEELLKTFSKCLEPEIGFEPTMSLRFQFTKLVQSTTMGLRHYIRASDGVRTRSLQLGRLASFH